MSLARKLCAHCRRKLVPDRPGQIVHADCAADYAVAEREKAERAEAKKARAAAKVERAETKRRKEAIKPRAKWLAECQAIVNKYVRLKAERTGEGCYTCGATPAQKFGGTYDASHFRSVGSAPHLRFWIPQIRICCVTCNRHQGGRLLEFRRHLVQEHGSEWVEALERRQEVAKFSIDYLARLKKVMSKKVRRMERRS